MKCIAEENKTDCKSYTLDTLNQKACTNSSDCSGFYYVDGSSKMCVSSCEVYTSYTTPDSKLCKHITDVDHYFENPSNDSVNVELDKCSSETKYGYIY